MLTRQYFFIRSRGFAIPCAILFLIGAMVSASCSERHASADWESVEHTIAMEFPEIRQITTRELSDIIADTSKEVMLLDVRAENEVAVSHLLGAVRVGSVQEANTLIKSAPHHTIIVAYCSVGYRSAELVSRLKAISTRDVYNLQGSLFRWANEERPVYRGTERVTSVHPFNDRWGALLNTSLHAYEPILSTEH